MPSPVDRNTALLEIITEGARAVMLDRNVYAECNQHLTGECADLRRKLRAAEDRIIVLQQQLDQERAGNVSSQKYPCAAVANQRGRQIPCDVPAPHTGRAHLNRIHQLMWAGGREQDVEERNEVDSAAAWNAAELEFEQRTGTV